MERPHVHKTGRYACDLLVIASLSVFILAIFSADSWAGLPVCSNACHASSADQLLHQQITEGSNSTDSCCTDESIDCTSSVCGACSGTCVSLDTPQISDPCREFLLSGKGTVGYRPGHSPPSLPPPQQVT